MLIGINQHSPETEKATGRTRMQKKWYRLDTAALIFPAITRRDWSNVFRLSVTLKENVDPETLQRAVDDLRPRFPSFFVSLKKGFFWYYLKEREAGVQVQPDYAYPLTFMSSAERKRCCLRVFCYRNRIAVECFHALTDGRGGSVLLASLTARYLTLKYGIRIPAGGPVRDPSEMPSPGELEDSFLKHAAKAAASRREDRAYQLRGKKEEHGLRHLTTGILDTKVLLDRAHEAGVSVTSFLAGQMAESIIRMQASRRELRRQKPVKITIPVDLRRLYGSDTLRNFSLVLNLGVDPRFGAYTADELSRCIDHQLRAFATPQYMAGMIAANVRPQKMLLLRLAPVGLKSLVMDSVYRRKGESGGSINVSNLVTLDLPEEMRRYVERAEFIIGPQRSYPNNCSVISYGGKTYINMIRNIRESELERLFFSGLVEKGIPVSIEYHEGRR